MTDDRSLPLRDRQRTRVRGDIQRAALELFAEHGYDSVTTDDIAAAAGVSPSTYFRHVGSKEELLLTPVRRGGAAIVAHLEARPADEPAGLALTQAILARTNAFTETSESVTHWRTAILGAPHLLDRVSLVERLSNGKLLQNLISIKFRILTERLCCCLCPFLFTRCVGMQCVLDLISQLGKNPIRNILRILCDKVNTNPF